MNKLIPIWILVLVTALWAPVASAQILNPNRPRPGAGASKPEKPAGPAEAAPVGEGEEPELPALPPWPGEETKKVKFFELKGYFRFRADMYHNLNLGLDSITTPKFRAPFYLPLSENADSSMNCNKRRVTAVPGGTIEDRGLPTDPNEKCIANTLGGANMRLRLEPTINVSEQVKVHAQFDVFDNLVLGSTPNGLSGQEITPNIPMTAFTDSAAPPIVGRNTQTPAIIVKRAWAEVMTPFGQLRFGRMPSQWGLGLLANNGSCWDCDYGDSGDRVMFATKVFGHILGMGYEFTSNGPTSLSVDSGQSYYLGQAIDLEQLDDVDQLFWVVGKIDKPDVIQDKVERGDLVLNYGAYVVWRKQDLDYRTTLPTDMNTERSLSKMLLERHAWAVIPDIWFKLLWGKFYLELEATVIVGKIENSDLTQAVSKDDPVDVLQFGWALKAHYKLMQDALIIRFDMGMASGDQTEIIDLNRRRSLYLPYDPNVNDRAINEFRFDSDYHVDLILFREIMSTVANAIYLKPSVQYNIFDSFGAKLDMIYSLAHRPIAYPGNSPHLGLEFDLDIFYNNEEEGFYAGLQYGMLIPLDGLDLPRSIYGKAIENMPVLMNEPDRTSADKADADLAHTFQARLIVKF